ncbi:hypothetical protein J2T12_004748 [Paenibacillus anaericanus]|nr:hypothetical protein [Paenibacillus anaericanus]
MVSYMGSSYRPFPIYIGKNIVVISMVIQSYNRNIYLQKEGEYERSFGYHGLFNRTES